MEKKENLAEIGIVIYPDALVSAVYGLTDLFGVANRLAAGHEGFRRPHIRVTHWRATDDGRDIACVYDTHEGRPHDLMMLVAPPTLGEPISKAAAVPFANWMKQQHDRGAAVSSVCAGSFLLGEAGLLQGRESTTHWFYAPAMAARFPETRVDSDRLVVDDGDIITAGGFMAWTDLGLRLVHRIMGPSLMLETARFMLVDPSGREQRHYSSFSPRLHHGDQTILKVQHWLQANGARDVSLNAMAEQAGLEPRTFLRRFQKATGMNPTEYCQHLRVGKAKEMLEFTNESMERVAWSVGYEDPGAFRKIFQRITGLSPAQYRERFSVAQQA